MNNINMTELQRIIDQALEEDHANNDVTTTCIAGSNSRTIKGYLIAKQNGVLAGIDVFKAVLQRQDKSVQFSDEMKDAQEFKNGDILIKFQGNAGPLLSAERTALNFLQHLSGVATYTNRFVKAVGLACDQPTSVRLEAGPTNGDAVPLKTIIIDTRKTIPGLRMLEKYAVKCGGGQNHRFNLSDMILIKDNHIALAGGITQALDSVKKNAPKSLKIEVETENLNQVKEALQGSADIIMLDNFNLEEMRQAVKLIAGKAIVEASGNVNLENVREIADTGVDQISVGRITHSAPGVDISMEFDSL
jgi:nicotinate-nucleotide pyrophosphorylase (carboxylating)